MSRATRYIKRLNTPALNRRRAVEYRHRKYNKSSNLLSLANKEVLNETVLDVKEEVITPKEEIKEVKKETTAVKKEDTTVNKESAEQESIIQKFKNFRRTRIRKRNAYLDSVINEPKANIFKMLFCAGTAVKDVSSVEDVTLNALAVLFLNAVKWIAFGSLFACLIGQYINYFPFSTSRINFTGMAKIAFFIGVLALIFEYLSYLLISIYCGLQRDNVKMRKLADIAARASVLPTVLFIIAILLTVYKSVTIGSIFAFTSVLISFILKIYGMTQRIKISVTKQLLIYFVCIFISVFIFIKILPFFDEGLINILKGLLNI